MTLSAIPNPYAILVAAAVLVGASGYAYMRGHSDGYNKCVAEYAKQREAAQNERDRENRIAEVATAAAASAAAGAINALEVRYVPIHDKVQSKVLSVPTYVSCKHDPDVLLQLNAALAGQTSASSPDPVGGGLVLKEVHPTR